MMGFLVLRMPPALIRAVLPCCLDNQVACQCADQVHCLSVTCWSKGRSATQLGSHEPAALLIGWTDTRSHWALSVEMTAAEVCFAAEHTVQSVKRLAGMLSAADYRGEVIRHWPAAGLASVPNWKHP